MCQLHVYLSFASRFLSHEASETYQYWLSVTRSLWYVRPLTVRYSRMLLANEAVELWASAPREESASFVIS